METQTYIDNLILFIDSAEDPESVTNVIVAAIFNYLNKGYKELLANNSQLPSISNSINELNKKVTENWEIIGFRRFSRMLEKSEGVTGVPDEIAFDVDAGFFKRWDGEAWVDAGDDYNSKTFPQGKELRTARFDRIFLCGVNLYHSGNDKDRGLLVRFADLADVRTLIQEKFNLLDESLNAEIEARKSSNETLWNLVNEELGRLASQEYVDGVFGDFNGKYAPAIQQHGIDINEHGERLNTVEGKLEGVGNVRDFVNSSVATNTAEFKGTHDSVEELERITADANDYCFVVGTDEEGNTVYNRYKYVEGRGWVFEYKLNNSSFTAAQWATIQSGLTGEDVAALRQIILRDMIAIQGHLSNLTNLSKQAVYGKLIED